MARIVIELTNRCNLRCDHCFTGRHGGKDDLPLAILRGVTAEARRHGFDELSFTGGDPTVYPHFAEALRLTHEAGYDFGFNTNGWSFATTYPTLLPYRDRLRVITFSLDGATEATHDRLRGRGSFRRVVQAVSVCVVEDLPFTMNMVVTAHNRHELAQMATLAHRLGSRGLRFGHLIPSPITTLKGFDLSPEERKAVETEIGELRRARPLPIAMAPGYHTTSPFPCAALDLQELNIDCHGNLTRCCHLSGHGPDAGTDDVLGNIGEIGFAEAYRRFVAEHHRFREAKLRHFAGDGVVDTDYFPCWYCSLHYRKAGWLARTGRGPWAGLVRELPVIARPATVAAAVEEV